MKRTFMTVDVDGADVPLSVNCIVRKEMRECVHCACLCGIVSACAHVVCVCGKVFYYTCCYYKQAGVRQCDGCVGDNGGGSHCVCVQGVCVYTFAHACAFCVYIRTYIWQGMHLLMRLFCIQSLLPIAAPHLRNIYPMLPVGNNNMVINLYYIYCVGILIWQCM